MKKKFSKISELICFSNEKLWNNILFSKNILFPLVIKHFGSKSMCEKVERIKDKSLCRYKVTQYIYQTNHKGTTSYAFTIYK